MTMSTSWYHRKLRQVGILGMRAHDDEAVGQRLRHEQEPEERQQ